MKLLRRLPALEAPLRDGRLSLTTVCVLGPVLTEENVDGLVARAAGLSKNDTVRLVASLRQVLPPAAAVEPVEPQGALGLAPVPAPVRARAPEVPPTVPVAAATELAEAGAPPRPRTLSVPEAPSPHPRADLRPVGADAWALRVTIDDEAREELLRLAALTAHSTRGDLAAVLRDAVRCALQKHGKRRGAIRPERSRRTVETPEPGAVAAPDPRAVPAAVRQAVWERDAGRCAWVSKDGKRCGSTWKLQLGHVRPVALGGRRRSRISGSSAPSTMSTKRSACSAGLTWRGSSRA